MTTLLSGADSSVVKGETAAAEELTEAIEALQVKVSLVYILCTTTPYIFYESSVYV